MPLNKDRGLELFDNVRKAIERDHRVSSKVINAMMSCSSGYPAVCFSHLDEVTRVQRHVGVMVADNMAMQAMLTMHRPTDKIDCPPTYLIPISDVDDMADLVLKFLLDDVYSTEPSQMKPEWKWHIRS